jgi:hypothetical protein
MRSRRIRRARRGVVATLALSATLAATSACTGERVLVAPDGARRLQAQHGGSGLSMIVTVGAWDGASYLQDDLTIVHVLVANMGREPVLLAPSDFSLAESRGFDFVLFDTGASFHAVPEGADLSHYRAPDSYDPGSGLGDTESVAGLEPNLARAALPWGVLQPGTQMRGYLYFEKVEDKANDAQLVWHAQTFDHRPLADFVFDLSVARLPRRR